MKRFLRIGLIVLIVIIVGIFGTIRIYRLSNDEYASIDYAVNGTGYSVDSVTITEGHVIYHIDGEGNYRELKQRYENFLETHKDSFLNKECPIEIMFKDKDTQMVSFGISNYIPQKWGDYCLFLYPDDTGIHKDFDVTILCHFWDEENKLGKAENNIDTKYLVIIPDVKFGFNGEYDAKLFPNLVYLIGHFSQPRQQYEEEFINGILKIHPNCYIDSYRGELGDR